MAEQKKPEEQASELQDEQLDQAGGAATSGDADDRPTEEVAFVYGKLPRKSF